MENAVLIIHGEKDKEIMVQYNPSEYTLDYSLIYPKKPRISKQNKTEQYIATESGTISFKLTIDGYTKYQRSNPDTNEVKADDISSDIDELRKLVQLDGGLHRPPDCEFKWGGLSHRGKVSSLKINYTMFDDQGNPIRATVDITIKHEDKHDVKMESPDRTKRHVLPQDMELYLLANELYGDPGTWREIAMANGIKNPRLLDTGMTLRIPPLVDNL